MIAANAPGDDGLWRTRQDAAVIDRYLAAARRAKALLILDIQPGHSDFLVEARALERWLREPDVGLALDPEWHTPGVQPGSEIGSATSEQVNAVSAWLANIVREERLPEKLFVVHEFTADMVEDRERVKTRPASRSRSTSTASATARTRSRSTTSSRLPPPASTTASSSSTRRT